MSDQANNGKCCLGASIPHYGHSRNCRGVNRVSPTEQAERAYKEIQETKRINERIRQLGIGVQDGTGGSTKKD